MALAGSGFSSGYSIGYGISEATVELDTTVAGETANSYVTVPEADLYFARDVFGAAWASKTATQKKQALITATQSVDRFDYIGIRTDPDQALDFPRYPGGTDRWESAFASTSPTVIPDDVKRGTLEMVKLLQNKADSTTGVIGRDIDVLDVFETIKLEYSKNVRQSTGYSVSGGGSIEAFMALMAPWIKGIGGSETFPWVK